MEGNKVKVPVRKKARIEIIPLIDVIFFLLATFVLFTLSLNRIQSVPVDLPVAAPPKDKPLKDESVTIQVSGEGAIFWNRELIDMNELPSRIAYYKTQTEDPRILIAGDEKARFGSTIAVLDEVRRAGILKFSVETRTRPTGK
ncbi:MAG: biopolymer transporter ExbD [Opitutae bacterium]|jgi:biopolymer transport protein ExbD